jgi:hypothetical protein
LIYYWKRVSFLVSNIFIFILIGGMLVCHCIISTDIISWIFFVLNFTNMAFLVRGENSRVAVNRSYMITNIMKAYSLIVLML